LAAALCSGVAAKDNLAVLPFTGGAAGEGETIAELFSFNNELNQVFSPIPRTSIARAISNEQKFQVGAGMTDPNTIAAIGKQLGASYVVAGNITRLGRQNLLIISILKIDDLRQIAGDIQTYARIEEIQAKLPEMARNIITATQINISGLDKLAVVPVELGGNIDPRVADTLAQILSINLIRSGKYLVYPRTETLEQVQEEYKTQLSGVTAEEHLVNMGKGENPQFVLSVVARRLGSQNMFNASIINLESGIQTIGGSVNYATLDDGMQVMESLARELTGIRGAFPSAESLEAVRDRAAAEAAASGDKAKEEAAPSASRTRRTRGTRKSGGAVFGYGILNLALGLGSFVQGDPGGGVMTLLSYGAAAGLVAWELTLAWEDDLAGIPGAAGLGVAGFAVLYGFIRPAVYNSSRPLAEIVDGIGVSILPGTRGREAILLSYTVKF
jgi:curli biogenesis system outer membrane secretion channel CsgG